MLHIEIVKRYRDELTTLMFAFYTWHQLLINICRVSLFWFYKQSRKIFSKIFVLKILKKCKRKPIQKFDQDASSHQTFVLIKTSWSRLEDQNICLSYTSSRRLQDIFKTSSRRLQDVLKTSSRCLQNVFKTSCKIVFKTSSRRLQDLLQRYLQDVSSS